jgi:hypothetical protein
VVVGKKYFQVKIMVKSLDDFVNVILTAGFLGMGMNFRPKPRMVNAAAGIIFLVMWS